MIPASAASMAPRRDVSSQGCTTIVVAAGTARARAIKRSYLLPGAWPEASSAATRVTSRSCSARDF
jgi:hypothetical protein